MPNINGHYYMNPQYGAALERDRAKDEEYVRVHGAPQPSWLDYFLGFVTPASQSRGGIATDDHPRSVYQDTALSYNAGRDKSPKVTPGSHESTPPADDRTVGNSVYNETSGLRSTGQQGAGSSQDLSAGREGLARVTKNLDASGTPVGKGTAPGRLTKGEVTAVRSYPPAERAYEDSQSAAGHAVADKRGPKHFYLDHGQPKPRWTHGKTPKESYGPFRNAAGHGDVPKGANVWIRVYD